MNPIDVLTREHRLIERVLDCLDELASRTVRGAELDRAGAASAIRFVRSFADARHHAKEEERLFPLLERKGVPRDGGPIGVMLHEHELGREAVRRMDTALGAGESRAFCEHARAYVELLRDHIGKEDDVLFRIAESILDEGERAALLDEFTRFDGSDEQEAVLREATALAEQLERAYGAGTPA